MHEKLFESLSAKILDLAARLRVFDPSDESRLPQPEGAPGRFYSFDGKVSFSADRSDMKTLRDLVSTIGRKAPSAEKISEKCIYDELVVLLTALLAEEDPAARTSRIASYFDNLASLVEPLKVLIPIFGLDLKMGGWAVGNVHLTKIKQPETHTSPLHQGGFFGGLIPLSMTQGVFALVEVVGEGTYAKDAARKEARRAMDLLRFGLAMLPYEPGIRRIVALEDEYNPHPENRTVLILPKTGVRASVHFQLNDESPPLVPWELTPQVASHLERIALARLTPLLKQRYDDLNTFQKSVIRAVHWVADSQMQIEVENRLLSLVTAMETLFTKDDGSPISNTIAEGVAFVAGGDAKRMREIKDLVKRLYKLRSTVSHGGHASVFQADIDALMPLCRSVMTWTIEKLPEFKDQSDLVDWIEDRKFSLPASEQDASNADA